MPFPNPNISDILATTIEFRSRDIADNMQGNIGLLAYLRKRKGGVKMITGGTKVIEEFNFGENANAAWYSGPDFLSMGASDNLSGAEYTLAQAAVPVIINGLEKLQNAGKEQVLDLAEARLDVGEKTMLNLMSGAVYSDGTGFGGKQLTGVGAAVPTSPTTGTYGGINRATTGNEFWRPKLVAPGAGVITALNVNTYLNDMWVKTQRGKDHPKLIVSGDAMWKIYVAYLQERSRFTSVSKAGLGFPTVEYMDADVILDGGIQLGSSQGLDTNTMLFLNLDYLFFRPHKDRNMVPLNPGRRYAINQDVEAQILAFAGQMTSSGQMFHGRLHNN